MKINNLLIACLALAAAACNTLSLPDRTDTAGGGSSVLRMVKVSRDTISILQQGSYALHASFYPQGAEGEGVSWKSLDETVATVDGGGVVRGVGLGSTHVVATSLNGALTDSCVVKVLSNVLVERVELSCYEASLKIGESLHLEATVIPPDARVKDIEWASLNPEVATVTAKGTVAARAPGETDITATSVEGGIVATCHVTVSRIEVVSVTVAPSQVSLHPGETFQLQATVLPDNATIQDVSWTSSAPAVASVTGTGLVTAEAVGDAVITATALDGGLSAVCEVAVSAIPAGQKVLTFDFSNGSFESLASAITAVNAARSGDNPISATFDMADSDNNGTFEWELYTGYGNSFSYSSNGYLVLNAACYLGTPVIANAKLMSLTFTQGAKTQASRRATLCTATHKGALKYEYYDASIEGDGAAVTTSDKNTDYTFTVKDPVVGARYYLVCCTAGIGVSKVVLVYEEGQ